MLLPYRLTLMQRLQDAARNDYAFYTTGTIDRVKWEAFVAKMSGAYETDLPKSTRSKRRSAGEAVSLLYGCEPPPYADDQRICWVLVVSAGRGRVHGREQLLEFAKQRLELDGYELVHDGVGWSWRMTTKRYHYWRERIHAVAAKRPEKRSVGEDAEGTFDADIETVMDALYNAPGFRLVRRQVGHLVNYAKGEWKRLRPMTGVQIRSRSFLPYVQRLPNAIKPKASVPLSDMALNDVPPKKPEVTVALFDQVFTGEVYWDDDE